MIEYVVVGVVLLVYVVYVNSPRPSAGAAGWPASMRLRRRPSMLAIRSRSRFSIPTRAPTTTITTTTTTTAAITAAITAPTSIWAVATTIDHRHT